jgi:hypothetical protein
METDRQSLTDDLEGRPERRDWQSWSLRCQLLNPFVTSYRHHHDAAWANALCIEGILVTFC